MASRATAMRMLALDVTIAEIVPALRETGIEPILLKGHAVAAWLYADPNERDCCDIDLLVPADRHRKAETVLATHGFVHTLAGADPREDAPHASTWKRDAAPPATIDLHRRLNIPTRAGVDPYTELRGDADVLDIAGVSVTVPSPAALALTTSLHALHHGPDVERPRMEVARAIDQVDRPTWEAAARLARRLGVGSEMAAGLELAGGRALAQELGLPRATSYGTRLRAAGASNQARRIAWVVEGEPTWPRRMRHAAALVFPTPSYLRYVDPLARRGRRGLWAAYLRRPFRLAVRLPRSLADHLRVAAPALGGGLRGAVWGERALRIARRQLRGGGLDHVRLPDPPAVAPGVLRGVRWALAHERHSCLERAVVRRTWHLAQGDDRRVVIGISQAGEPFGAHAWLEGDRDGAGLQELHRWP